MELTEPNLSNRTEPIKPNRPKYDAILPYESICKCHQKAMYRKPYKYES